MDHIYTNIPKSEICTKVILDDITDHLPLLVSLEKIRTVKPPKQTIVTQDFSNFQPDIFLSDLQNVLSNFQIDNHSNINQTWDDFENLFTNTVYKHAPLRNLTRKEIKLRSKPWITKGILRSSKTQLKMFKNCIKRKDPTLTSEYKIFRNKLTRLKQLSKKLYFQKSVMQAQNNSKHLWKTINNIINYKNPKKSTLSHLEDKHGNKITDPEQISNIMNHNFVSIVDTLMENNQSDTQLENENLYKADRISKSFFLKPFTESEIVEYINSLDCNKSSRSDLPKIQFLKLSVEIIAPFINQLFNQCISQNTFPTSFKLSEIIPIYKTGSKTDTNNFRPIALLSPFSKIFEFHLHKCLMDFFIKNKVIYKKQFGFKESSSTDIAVLRYS